MTLRNLVSCDKLPYNDIDFVIRKSHILMKMINCHEK